MWPSGSGCILPVTWPVSALGTRDVLRIKPKVYFGFDTNSSCMCTAEHIAFQSVQYKAHTCALESFILVQLFISRCYKQRKRFCTCLNQSCMHFLTPSHKSLSMLASVIIAVLSLYKCYSSSHFLISLFSSQIHIC